MKTSPSISWLLLSAAALSAFGLAHPAAGQTVTEFPLPRAESQPWAVAVGPGGDLWFSEGTSATIGRISTRGILSEISLPAPSKFGVGGVAPRPDGTVWFTGVDIDTFKISLVGRITPEGKTDEFLLDPASCPGHITPGPDGNLWFTELGAIVRITPEGVITQFGFSPGNPEGITVGPDGNIWFTVPIEQLVGRITMDGKIELFQLPKGGNPLVITAGPDGALWFTEFRGNRIGRITTTGAITEFEIPTPGSNPYFIASGHDGSLWFTEISGNKIGRITTDGAITEIPMPGSGPAGIAVAPDGTVWFAEFKGNKIGKIQLAPIDREPPTHGGESRGQPISVSPRKTGT